MALFVFIAQHRASVGSMLSTPDCPATSGTDCTPRLERKALDRAESSSSKGRTHRVLTQRVGSVAATGRQLPQAGVDAPASGDELLDLAVLRGR